MTQEFNAIESFIMCSSQEAHAGPYGEALRLVRRQKV